MTQMKNKLFWNVDTQEDFMSTNGTLFVGGSDTIRDTLKQLTLYAKNNGISVVNTSDWHYNDSEELSNFPDFVETFPPHCMVNSHGAELIRETKPSSYDLVIDWDRTLDSSDLYKLPSVFNILLRKDKFDFISGNPNSMTLLNHLRDYEEIFVYGVVSEICVKHAVEGLLENGFKVTLVRNAIMHLDEQSYLTSLLKWGTNPNFDVVDFEPENEHPL